MKENGIKIQHSTSEDLACNQCTDLEYLNIQSQLLSYLSIKGLLLSGSSNCQENLFSCI